MFVAYLNQYGHIWNGYSLRNHYLRHYTFNVDDKWLYINKTNVNKINNGKWQINKNLVSHVFIHVTY